jgi:sugar lactone lactonase YvrE
MSDLAVKCVIESADKLGEGCLWDQLSGALWWLDIARPSRIHRMVMATGEHKVWTSPLLLTTLALRRNGGLVVGGENGVYLFDTATGLNTNLCYPETDRPFNRFNDGACDPQGRLWIGTMQQNIGANGEDLDITENSGALYRVTGDGASKRFEDHIGVSNGPCWSPDGKTFYFSDSRNQVIYAYDFDSENGAIRNRRVLNDTKNHGYPDGATVDAEGFIWSARWDGSCVLRISPTGKIDRVVAMPALRPTCVCFGGESMDEIFVTSSRAHLSPQQMAEHPQQGGVFSFKPSVRGPLKHRFNG